MKKSLPSIPRNPLEVKFAGWEDKKRVYLADTYHTAVKFVGSLKTWGTIVPHNGGINWKITV